MLRRVVAPALWALRTYRGSALLISATAAVGVAARRGGTLGMSWSSLAWGPGATDRAALEILFRLLLGVATGVLAVAALTIVSLSAARAAGRSQDVKLHRAF